MGRSPAEFINGLIECRWPPCLFARVSRLPVSNAPRDSPTPSQNAAFPLIELGGSSELYGACHLLLLRGPLLIVFPPALGKDSLQ